MKQVSGRGRTDVLVLGLSCHSTFTHIITKNDLYNIATLF